MAQTRTRSPTDPERQRISDIIERHAAERPDGVRRVGVKFGEDQAGKPAVYLELFVGKDLQPTKAKIEELNSFVQVIEKDILKESVDYWPYARTLTEE